NVKLYFPPAAMVPESNTPLSLVAVCVMVSLFVQVTVDPAVIVTGFGMYAALPALRAPTGIVTLLPAVDVGVGLGEVAGEEELPPHAPIIAIAPERMASRKVFMTSVLLHATNSNEAAVMAPRWRRLFCG